MSDSQKSNNIPLLKPIHFKDELIDGTWDPSIKSRLNEFFIHSFMDDIVPLKLPLPLHKKTVNDFVLVTNGRMTKTIGLESFPLKANEFLFTPKSSITTTRNVSGDLEGFYCHFSDDFIANNSFLRRWKTQATIQNFLILREEEIATVLPLLDRIATLYREAGKNLQNYRLIQYYLSTFIAEVSVISERNVLKQTIHPLVIKFQQMVNERFKESKNVKFYADLLHVSANHLNKIVKKETGKTALAIIHNICLLEAKVLLHQTDLNISQVAYELGFEDTSYFGRFFKKYTDLSPSAYRKMIDLS